MATLFLTLGIYVSFLTATAYLFASIALMLPLAKEFRAGGFLAYVATVLLSLLIGGGFAQIWRLFPFIVFFGLHPLVNSFQKKWKINKWIALAVKIVWFDVSMWLFWEFSQLIAVPYEWIDRYIVLIIATLGSAFLVFYDWVMTRCQKLIDFYVSKIDKSSRSRRSPVRRENKIEDVFGDPFASAEEKDENTKKPSETGADPVGEDIGQSAENKKEPTSAGGEDPPSGSGETEEPEEKKKGQ